MCLRVCMACVCIQCVYLVCLQLVRVLLRAMHGPADASHSSFRSERMSYIRVVLDREMAKTVLSEFGELETLEFVDVRVSAQRMPYSHARACVDVPRCGRPPSSLR